MLNLIRGRDSKLMPPVDDMNELWTEQEKVTVRDKMMRYSAIGSPDTVKTKLDSIVKQTRANELMTTSQLYDHQSRLRSFELLAQVMQPDAK